MSFYMFPYLNNVVAEILYFDESSFMSNNEFSSSYSFRAISIIALRAASAALASTLSITSKILQIIGEKEEYERTS